MKAFLVGLVFVLAVAILAVLGFLLLPIALALSLVFELLAMFVFVVMSIWLLGKFILYVWKKLKE